LTATKLYRLAADQGDVNAQYNLARMLEEGQGVEKNEKEAAKFYRLAADQGDAYAQYSLACMLKEGQGEKYFRARKEGDKENKDPSLRFDAKKNGFTTFGEIFDTESLETLAKERGITDCKTINIGEINQKTYIDTICKNLKDGYLQIAAADLESDSLFPRPTGRGDDTTHCHWAVIFGYYYSNDKCQFLVSQDGKYYVWDAEDLYHSNKNLPTDSNPQQNLVYYKTNENNQKQEYLVQTPPDSVKTRKTTASNLAKFKFGIFGVKSQSKVPCIEVKPKSMKNES